MTGMLLQRDPDLATPPGPSRGRSGGGRRGRWTLPVHWPLSAMVLGFPLWWALGLRTVVPMLMAVVMADQLLRRRRLSLPAGFTLWVLYLAWLTLGVFVLFADAPGAEPGGGPSRLAVFGYRLAWYLTATVALVWITNLRESQLPTRWLYQLLGFMFVVTTVGGLVGVLAPHIEFTSPLEMLLPRGLRSNGLVQAIAHPAVADIQNVLGRPEARPKAPFPFANSWGSNLSLYLPFFLVAWFGAGRRRWQPFVAPFVLVAAMVPVVYSLNRGLWISLGIGVVGLLVLQLRRGRPVTLLATAALLVVAGLVFLASPLGTVFTERLANQHSNDRRSELISRTVSSTVEGSPVVGFGSTRDVQGGFSSIAGADTPDCSACGVPPLGTQGHLWGVIFGQGLLGAALFAAFFAVVISRCWRCRTPSETVCTFVMVFFGFQVLVYDTLGMPLLTVMIAAGLVAREQLAAGARRSSQLVVPALSRVRDWWPILVVLTLLGAALGGVVAARTPTTYATRVSILLAQPPVYLSAVPAVDDTSAPGDVTIDTEAALVIARQSLTRVVGSRNPADLAELRERVRVTAAPNTSVLTLAVSNRNAAESRDEAEALARSYLVTRRAFLSNRQDQALALLREQLAQLRPASTSRTAAAKAAAARDRLEEAVTTILLTPTTAGEVIRTREPAPLRRQSEVPVTSGAALGLALGAVAMAALPGSRPWAARRRRSSR